MSRAAAIQDGDEIRIGRLERDVDNVVKAVESLRANQASMQSDVHQISTTIAAQSRNMDAMHAENRASIQSIMAENGRRNKTNWGNVIAAGGLALMLAGMLAALVEMRIQPVSSREDSLWDAYGRMSEKAATKETVDLKLELEASRRDLAIERKGKPGA